MNILAENTDIIFPGLGIHLKNVGSFFHVFGIDIAYYGVCIALGMLAGYLLAAWQAKRTGQDPEFYLDFTIYAIVFAVVGARLYYVLFRWDMFKDDPASIINLRTGGLAIYGGILGGILTAVIFTRLKKYPFWKLADIGGIGLLTGQIIGRWGNFFNREAFGSYAKGPFRMLVNVKDTSWYFDPSTSLEALKTEYAGKTTALNRILEIRNNAVTRGGETYVSVHPTFLYEGIGNLIILLFILWYTKKQKKDGELWFIYLGGYGLVRFFVEGMRSDQLFLWGTGIAVSQLLAVVMMLVSVVMFIYIRKNGADAAYAVYHAASRTKETASAKSDNNDNKDEEVSSGGKTAE